MKELYRNMFWEKNHRCSHIIAKADSELYPKKMGIVQSGNEAVGILTITPSEASIIAVDIARQKLLK